jgi:hypothetical protein
MAINHVARHIFERIDNCLYFNLELKAKLDSYVQKNEEAEE